MNSTILWTKNENGTLDRVLGLNDSTILTTNKNLSQLSDVSGTPSDQQALIYNANTAKWVPSLPRFANLGDVSFSNLAGSNVIKWDTSAVRWTNRNTGYAILTITGKITDAKFNTGTEFNILNPANYDPITPATNPVTYIFTIQAFSNNGIQIVTDATIDTPETNCNIRNLLSGSNYRIEWNFNYTASTPPGTNNIVLSFFIYGTSPTVPIGTTSYRLGVNSINITNSLTIANSNSNNFRFMVRKDTAVPAIAGLPDLNVNITISVIEM